MKTYATIQDIREAKELIDSFAKECIKNDSSFEYFQTIASGDSFFTKVFGKSSLKRIINSHAPFFK